jgi:agmatine deiminase
MKSDRIPIIIALIWLLSIQQAAAQATYIMPAEEAKHEGTWLQWPHNYLYGPWYRDDVEPSWVAMTAALQAGEKVHIIAYDSTELNHIKSVLNQASVPMGNIDFFIYKTDDVWVRDNGPIFVYDNNNNLVVLDWGFNGWGNDTPFSLCDSIPFQVSRDLSLPRVDLSAMVLEGGAIEHDGNGTMMATRSSVTHSSRNPNLTEAQIEQYLTNYMGFTKFIWLDGVYGLEITDMHIDGFARFANDSTIVTMNRADLIYWDVPAADIDTLFSASDVDGNAYAFSYLPLTQNDVVTTYGKNLGYKGSYVNYYIGNKVVLVPTYNDPNDSLAVQLVQNLYPNRTAIGVDVRNLYEYGGMIHCVTQQQPINLNPVGVNEIKKPERSLIGIYDLLGRPSSDRFNTFLIYLYSDGSTEKVFRIK